MDKNFLLFIIYLIALGFIFFMIYCLYIAIIILHKYLKKNSVINYKEYKDSNYNTFNQIP